MSSLTGNLYSIEAVARKLDESRQTRLGPIAVDFDAYLQARDEDVAAIKGPDQFRDELVDEFFNEGAIVGAYLPWGKAQDLFRIRHGELTIWAGFNGHMKSMLTTFVMLDLIHQGEKVCVASFEMKPRKTLRRMATQSIGTKNPTEKYVHKFMDDMTGKLWLYDQQGKTSPERVLAVLYYCAEQLGVTQFIIDSLMTVIGDEDAYNEQKNFVNRLATAARDLNIHIHLVHHSRKKEDESKRPGKQDAKGSGAIVDLTDNYCSVFKFPRKEDDDEDRPTHGLYVDKQRHGEWEGLIALWFDDASLQFLENPHTKARLYTANMG